MTYDPPPPGGSGQPTPAEPSGPPPTATQQPFSFFNALFDFSFNRFVTPSVVRVLYILGLVAIILIYLVYLTFAFGAEPILGLAVLLLGWIVPLLYITLWRVILEFFVAVIRMSEDIHHRGSVR